MWIALAISLAVQTQTRLVAVASAESLRVTESGAGAPVVLVPGLIGAAFGFRIVSRDLDSSGYRALIIEPLGIGGSGRPRAADYSLSAQAARLGAALDTLGVRAAIIVSHDVSASIALRLAIDRPDLVRAIVAIEGGAAETLGTPGFRRSMQLAPIARLLGGSRIIRAQIRHRMKSASADPSWVTDDVVAGYMADAAADLGGFIAAYRQMAWSREPEPLASRLGSVRCPVRLLMGVASHGNGPPLAEVEATRGVTDFAVDSIPLAGHFIQEERPDAVVDAVRRLDAATSGRDAPGTAP